MLGWIHALITTLAMVTFFGIIWWAWSDFRAQANRQASMLPFDLPDEAGESSDGATDE